MECASLWYSQILMSTEKWSWSKAWAVLCDTVIVAGVLGYIIPHVGLNSLPW